MDDLLSDFLTETTEALEELDNDLVSLERNPEDQDIIGRIFRVVHTIKGTCGFLDLPRLEAVSHACENLLGRFRSRELAVTPDRVTLILQAIDQIKSILASLSANGKEPQGDDQNLIARLNNEAGLEPETETDSGPSAESVAEATPSPTPETTEAQASAMAGEGMHSASAASPPPPVAAKAPPPPQAQPRPEDIDAAMMEAEKAAAQASKEQAESTMPEPETPKQNASGSSALSALSVMEEGVEENIDEDNEAMVRAFEAWQSVASSEGDTGHPPPSEPKGPPPPSAFSSPAPDEGEGRPVLQQQTLRVSVELLENLMTMVSELVLTRNQLLQLLRQHQNSDFSASLQRLHLITSELQEGVMKTRMQPIGNAWSKLPRIVRDLSRELGKKIDLVMSGAETELDRQVLDIVRDPLMHMVRNAADHGIESPEERKIAGKDETGHIRLNAYHEGGHIIIDIGDDGKGINLEQFRRKIVDMHLASEAEASVMSETQLYRFMFHAGFSTAKRVTAVSGRGVGLDVVKNNIDRIGGTIEMSSEEGVHTSFQIKIPLTLAIVPGLIMSSAGERFAIPQISVVELVRAADTHDHRIDHIQNTPVLRLRNRLLPLVSIRGLLGLEDKEDAPADSKEEFIVVTKVGGIFFGLLVDKVFDTEEIVVKPVSKVLRQLTVFAGNTILGDGSVIMILDPNGIAQSLGQIQLGSQIVEEAHAESDKAEQTSMTLLLFKTGENTQKAVPIGVVARLEEIDLGRVEYSNRRPMVQYRNSLMPLMSITGDFSVPQSGVAPVLVFSDETRTMGLIVEEIIDIIEEKLDIHMTTDTPGVIGSSIIRGLATDIIDAEYFWSRAFSSTLASARVLEPQQKKRARVLLIDANAFYRDLVTPYLSAGGYDVVTVTSTGEARQLCSSGSQFSAIISDVDREPKKIYEFVSDVRENTSWARTPVLGLTANVERIDVEEGYLAGFTDFIVKHDKAALMKSLVLYNK